MPMLFLTVVIDLIGFGIVIPILPFLSPKLGATEIDIALIIVAFALSAAICSPFWGRLSDRIGRKPVILICLTGGALSYVMLAMATELWMIYASRIFAGVMAGNFGVASAMVADITTPQTRAKGMGMISAGFGVGMILGPALGGLLSGDNGDFQLACMVAGSVSFLAMLAGLIFLRESLPAEKRAEHREEQRDKPRQPLFTMLRQNNNLLLVLQYLLHAACISSVTYLFPLWVGHYQEWGAREVGTMLAIQGIAVVLMQFFLIGWLTRMFGELRVLLASVALLAAGFGLASIARHPVAMVATFYLALTGANICTPVLNSLVSKRTPIPLRGQTMGATASMSAAGRVFGPLLASAALALFGFTWAWIISGLQAVLFLSWVLARLRRDDLHALPEPQAGEA